jgi:ankyrin repeat protein
MPQSLPESPSMAWLRKTAKQKLKVLRGQNPSARLADAQFALAHDYGFASWRLLKRHVDDRSRGHAIEESSSEKRVRDELVGTFLRSVGTGQVDEARAALATDPSLVNAVGPHPFWGGRPQALHVAIETKRRDMFDLLLVAGADVNGTNDEYDFWSPLMLAIKDDLAGMRQELIGRGAHVGLAEALLAADDVAVDALLRDASRLPAEVPNRGSFLNLARTPLAIDRLVQLGASPNARDRWGSTPIDSMSRLGPNGHSLVQRMVANGIQARPVEYARLGDRRALEAIIDADPSVVKSDAVFMGAVDFAHYALVEWLIERGANINARSDASSHHTALHSAAWNGDLCMVKLLVEAGADVSAIDDEHHGAPIQWARAAIEITNNTACYEVAELLSHLV